jgi:hypothetical protein
MTDLYLDTSTTQTFYNFTQVNVKIILNIDIKAKVSVRYHRQGDYIVTSCSLHRMTASLNVFLRKTSKESNPESVRKIEKS